MISVKKNVKNEKEFNCQTKMCAKTVKLHKKKQIQKEKTVWHWNYGLYNPNLSYKFEFWPNIYFINVFFTFNFCFKSVLRFSQKQLFWVFELPHSWYCFAKTLFRFSDFFIQIISYTFTNLNLSCIVLSQVHKSDV